VKRKISLLLAVLLLLTCMLTEIPTAHASTKAGQARTIAIVFDNSGSMYDAGDQAWCRATYAMEVFASMLNKGDLLQVYPMNPIQIDGKEYTMDSPFQLTDASQASDLRRIFTERASGTPIESIDRAIEGLNNIQTGKKYLIVLTDGGTFSKNNSGLTKVRTARELDKRVTENAGPDMTVMYLGIGSDACMPTTEESEYFFKTHASNTEDVLYSLTVMCNQVFGRDSLPKDNPTDMDFDFDITMSKLIVFVQGENIEGVKATDASGNPVGTLLSTQQTKYSTEGCGNYPEKPDTSLQGMMVTYGDCDPGQYSISCSGTVSSVDVYYEPDADLDFVFTDARGNTVNPNALYEGDYKVSFGIKDAKTGKLISSELLGNPHYQGSYSVSGKETPIVHDGYSGEVPVALQMDDTFNATLTVTYLNGYTITKDSSDFGWPDGGIQVAALPAGELMLEISGGDSVYSLQTLPEGTPFTAKVFYEGSQLTGKELESVELKWNPDTSNAEIKKDFADDHWDLYLDYKDPDAPQNTACGECTVSIYAYYAAQGTSQAQAESPLTYTISDDAAPVMLDMYAPEDYIVIDRLQDSAAIVAKPLLNGLPMTPADFSAVELQVDCGGIDYTVTPDPQEGCYLIQLLPTAGLKEDDYEIRATAYYTDPIGRVTQAEDALSVTLSNVPLWVRWAFGLAALIGAILLIVAIMRTKVMPKHIRPDTEGCSLSVGGKNVASDATFSARRAGKQLITFLEYNGEEIGRISVRKVAPGKGAFLCKPSHKRSILVKFPEEVSASGGVTTADLDGIEYYVDRSDNFIPREEQQAPFTFRNGSSVTMSGKVDVGGKTKNFTAEIPLSFKK